LHEPGNFLSLANVNPEASRFSGGDSHCVISHDNPQAYGSEGATDGVNSWILKSPNFYFINTSASARSSTQDEGSNQQTPAFDLMIE